MRNYCVRIYIPIKRSCNEITSQQILIETVAQEILRDEYREEERNIEFVARDDEKTGTFLTIDKNKIMRETKEHTKFIYYNNSRFNILEKHRNWINYNDNPTNIVVCN